MDQILGYKTLTKQFFLELNLFTSSLFLLVTKTIDSTATFQQD